MKGKNLALVDGKPLFLHAADALSFCDRVIVSTDDDTIAAVAGLWGYDVHRRDAPDDQTVLDVARSVVADSTWTHSVLLLQPTVPPTFDVYEWANQATTRGLPAVAGQPIRHLTWGSESSVLGNTERLNRQWLDEWPMKEIGLYYWPTGEVSDPQVLVPVDGEAFDIDTPSDLEATRRHYNRKTILIRYIADETRGTGHVRRMLTLAEGLQHHDIVFQAAAAATSDSGWPSEIAARGWGSITHNIEALHNRTVPDELDLVITDTLDSDYALRGNWITFEDRGRWTPYADLTINALYGRQGWHNERSGPDWAILRPEFHALPPYEIRDTEKVLVVFGGTDPAGLTKMASQVLAGWDHTIVHPGENRPMAELMHTHDLLITSAGRTVYEAAAVGIPSIVLAQNNREATHVHLGPHHGNIYLGLGQLVSPIILTNTIDQVIADRPLRAELSRTAKASIDGKGLDRIVAEIDRILEGRL